MPIISWQTGPASTIATYSGKFACISVLVYMKRSFLCVIIALSLNRPCKGNRRVGRVSLKCFRVSRLCDFFKRRHVSRLRAGFPRKNLLIIAFASSPIASEFFLCVISAPLISFALFSRP